MAVNGCPNCLEKQREIDKLKEEVQRLKAALRYRKRTAEEGLFGSSTPSAKLPVKPNVPEKTQSKKRGGQVGHAGAGRKTFDAAHADKVVHLDPPPDEACPFCEGRLEDGETEDRPVLDAEPTKAQRILYRRPCKRCVRCGKRVKVRLEGVLPRGFFGNQLLANVIAMHYMHGVPLERTAEQLGVNASSLVHALHRVAKLFACVPEKLIEFYRQAPVRHADETGWRYEGKNGYVWLFATPTLSIFRFDKTRSATVPRAIFGDERLGGVLVVDRYHGYNKVPCNLQYCYSHLLREVKDLAKEFPEAQEVSLFVSLNFHTGE